MFKNIDLCHISSYKSGDVGQLEFNRNCEKDYDEILSDLAFAMFLEGHAKDDWSEGVLDHALGLLIEAATPSPNVVHVELLVPPNRRCPPGRLCNVNFATYIGGPGAAWQNDDLSETFEYYIKHNGGRWRAVPLWGKNARERIRSQCNRCEGAPYSISRYLTSLPPLRSFAGLWLANEDRSPGHCATLTARVVSKSRMAALPQKSSYYSPSSLYRALVDLCAQGTADAADTVSSFAELQGPLVSANDVDRAINTLLHEPLTAATVRAMGDERCARAIRELAARCTDAHARARETSARDADIRLAEHMLATALLRWTSLRASSEKI